MLQKQKYLNQKEAKMLMSYCKKMSKTKKPYFIRAWAIVDFLLGTGCRASECRLLRISDLHLKDGFIIVNGKGGIIRHVIISKKLITHLKTFLRWKEYQDESVEQNDYLFTNRLHKENTLAGIQFLFKKLAAGAGLNSVYSIHSTRHCFGFMVYSKTTDIRLCQEMLGHKSISSTQIYAHVTAEKIVETINGLW